MSLKRYGWRKYEIIFVFLSRRRGSVTVFAAATAGCGMMTNSVGPIPFTARTDSS
jgi:hypothetical protein